MPELIPDVRDAAAGYLRLSALLLEASAVEYSAAPIPKPREDNDGGKALGGHGDPTGDIALDPRRLAVRASAQETRHALRLMAEAAVTAEARLRAALDAWEGKAAA